MRTTKITKKDVFTDEGEAREYSKQNGQATFLNWLEDQQGEFAIIKVFRYNRLIQHAIYDFHKLTRL